MKEAKPQKHEFEPVYQKESRVLILGTFPSVKSREYGFYYGHPQNRFWKVMAGLFSEKVPSSIEEKKILLLKHKIALWDVVKSCDIIGSSDISIHHVVPVDINRVLNESKIGTIFTNGATAKKLYDKYLLSITGKQAIKLPSTSPANAAFSLEKLLEEWNIVLQKIRCE